MTIKKILLKIYDIITDINTFVVIFCLITGCIIASQIIEDNYIQLILLCFSFVMILILFVIIKLDRLIDIWRKNDI